MPLDIRPLQAADIPLVAVLHTSAFPGFFLTSLGERALRELYSAIISDSRGIAIVAREGSRVVGFAAGAIDGRSSYKRILVRRWWRLAIAVAPVVLRRASLIFRIAWRMRSIPSSPPRSGEALLASVAVSPSDHNRGIGRTLVREFIAIARQKGARSVCLSTDGVENDRVERFYQAMGFRRLGAYTTRENRRIHEYVIDI